MKTLTLFAFLAVNINCIFGGSPNDPQSVSSTENALPPLSFLENPSTSETGSSSISSSSSESVSPAANAQGDPKIGFFSDKEVNYG